MYSDLKTRSLNDVSIMAWILKHLQHSKANMLTFQIEEATCTYLLCSYSVIHWDIYYAS